jgi:peptidoglycan/LPS O-acetylase OafA/YrhL
MEHRQVAGLDLIRFTAAVMVMMFHIPFEADHRLVPIGWFGWVGVQVFFVLSGVVIANSAEHGSAATFLRSRILRLYPAVWICATVSFLIVGCSFASYVRSLALLPYGPWVDGVYWTLGVEMSFYGIVTLLLWRGWFGELSGVLAGLAIVSTVYWSLRIASTRFPGLAAVMAPISDARITQLLLLPDGAQFAAGGLIWLCVARRTTLFRLAFLGLSLMTGAAEIFSIAYRRARELHQFAMTPVLVWLMAVALIVVSFKVNTPQSRLVRWIGLATYPLYLLHRDIGRAVLRGSGNLVLAIVAPTLAAAIVTLLLEPPARRLLAGAFDRAGFANTRAVKA